MQIMGRLRLLPLLVLVALLAFTVRMGDFMARAGSAFAQEEVKGEEAAPPPLDEKPAAKEDGHTAEETKDDTHADAAPEAPAHPVEGEEAAEPAKAAEGDKEDWRDAGEEDAAYSNIKVELYKELTARREDMDRREKAMATREALLEAGERELDQKLRELTALRTEIEGLLKKQSDEENTRVQSLVKIYEGMKPGDAARIFNTLDMDVLIQVMTIMSERKAGAILAEMDPERARTITILLAQQNKLPELSAP